MSHQTGQIQLCAHTFQKQKKRLKHPTPLALQTPASSEVHNPICKPNPKQTSTIHPPKTHSVPRTHITSNFSHSIYPTTLNLSPASPPPVIRLHPHALLQQRRKDKATHQRKSRNTKHKTQAQPHPRRTIASLCRKLGEGSSFHAREQHD